MEDFLFLLFIGSLTGLIGKILLFRVVTNIPEIINMRISAIMFLFSACLFTFGTYFPTFVIAQVLYVLAPLFQQTAKPYINKYTELHKCKDEYTKIFSRADSIYSTLTLVLSLISGFIFNVNPYIAMAICICFCCLSLGITLYLKPIKTKRESLVLFKRNKTINRVPVNKLIIIVCIFQVISSLYCTGSKLNFQDISLNFCDETTFAYMFSLLMVINRIGRILSGILFTIWKSQITRILNYFGAISILICASILLLSRNIDNYFIFCILMYATMFVMAMLYTPIPLMNQNNMLQACNQSEKVKVIAINSILTSILETIFTWFTIQLQHTFGMISLVYVVLALSIVFFAISIIWKHIVYYNERKLLKRTCKKETTKDNNLINSLIYVYLHYRCVKFFYPRKRLLLKKCEKNGIDIANYVDVAENIDVLFKELQLNDISPSKREALQKFIMNHPIILLDNSNKDKPMWTTLIEIDNYGITVNDNSYNNKFYKWSEIEKFDKIIILDFK